jgi:glycosyltransferase involved in cell wall biosynthesis
MSSPALSVVIASVNGLPYLERCLESLERQAPDTEVIVADWTDGDTRRQVSERWPAVRLLSFEEPMAVPELRAAGIAAARAPYVAVIEDHCVVRDGWAARIRAAHRRGYPVVGGAVRNGATRRLRDWAAFFCEYSEHMDPLPEGPTRSLTGMNVSYDRRAIETMAPLLAEGRWETWLHPHLLDRGIVLYADGDMALDHVKDFDFREFVSQRYHYSRSHAGMRNQELGWKRLLYVLGSPALVPLLYIRIARNVFRKRRHRARFLAATPLVLVYVAVWSFGEAVGYAVGGGRSLLRVR